jgi:pimeloyl-ACP methyl ester carboxylesterase
VGDLDIAYESFGDPADPPLLLVAGLATQMLGWDERLCVQLADQGFWVVRFDNRDVGLSTHLAEAGTPDVGAVLRGDETAPAPPYTLLDMAGDTAGLLDALDLPSAHVVGASMGGMIAQQLAIGHPDRVRSLTSIMSTTCREVGKSRPEAMAALFLPPPRDSDEAAERALQVYRVIGSPAYPLDEFRLADVARAAFARGHDAAGVARQLSAIAVSPDRTPGLRALRVPTLVIHGQDDSLVEVDGGVATAEAVPGARLVVIPGMGHNLPESLWPTFVDEIVDHARSAEGKRAART